MSDEPVERHVGAPPSHRLVRAAQWASAVAVLLTSAGILILIVTGHTGPVQAVAAFGAASAVGGAVVTVTVNIVRR
jgi:hypothetical protein